jgi:hypothetical protein
MVAAWLNSSDSGPDRHLAATFPVFFPYTCNTTIGPVVDISGGESTVMVKIGYRRLTVTPEKLPVMALDFRFAFGIMFTKHFARKFEGSGPIRSRP